MYQALILRMGCGYGDPVFVFLSLSWQIGWMNRDSEGGGARIIKLAPVRSFIESLVVTAQPRGLEEGFW